MVAPGNRLLPGIFQLAHSVLGMSQRRVVQVFLGDRESNSLTLG